MNKEQLKAYLGNVPADARLVFAERSTEEFRSSLLASRHCKPYLDEIRAESERLLREPISEPTYTLFSMFERCGSRLEYERVYFEKRRRLNTMALMTLLEPDQLTYREALQDAIWSICNEYTWCLPAHLRDSAETDGSLAFSVESAEWSRKERNTRIDLFAAETGFTLSEILRLTESWLPPLLRSRIQEEVVNRLFKPYLLHGPYHWETAKHNWASVCAGSIASAALLMIESAEQLAPLVEKALAGMDYYLAGFGDDGACLEGIGYWNYGFGYFVYFADLLKKRTAGRIDLFQRAKVRRIAAFQQKAYLDGDLLVNFSDSPPRANVQIGLTHYLAGVYPEVAVPPHQLSAAYTEDHCSRWAPTFRNLLWFDPNRSGSVWSAADHYLEDAQWLVSRHAAAGRMYGFAAKGGHNDEPHNHNDIGQFLLSGGGQMFLCDLGYGEYTAQYFGSERYTYECNGSHGHSVPIIDGQYQAQGAESAATDVRVSIGEREDRLQLEMKDAYRLPHLILLARELIWRKEESPALILRDRFAFSEEPSSIVERIITRIKPSVGAESMMLQGDEGNNLLIRFDPSVFQPNVTFHTYRDHSGKDSPWYALDFSIRQPERNKEHDVELIFQFVNGNTPI